MPLLQDRMHILPGLFQRGVDTMNAQGRKGSALTENNFRKFETVFQLAAQGSLNAHLAALLSMKIMELDLIDHARSWKAEVRTRGDHHHIIIPLSGRNSARKHFNFSRFIPEGLRHSQGFDLVLTESLLQHKLRRTSPRMVMNFGLSTFPEARSAFRNKGWVFALSPYLIKIVHLFPGYLTDHRNQDSSHRIVDIEHPQLVAQHDWSHWGFLDNILRWGLHDDVERLLLNFEKATASVPDSELLAEAFFDYYPTHVSSPDNPSRRAVTAEHLLQLGKTFYALKDWVAFEGYGNFVQPWVEQTSDVSPEEYRRFVGDKHPNSKLQGNDSSYSHPAVDAFKPFLRGDFSDLSQVLDQINQPKILASLRNYDIPAPETGIADLATLRAITPILRDSIPQAFTDAERSSPTFHLLSAMDAIQDEFQLSEEERNALKKDPAAWQRWSEDMRRRWDQYRRELDIPMRELAKLPPSSEGEPPNLRQVILRTSWVRGMLSAADHTREYDDFWESPSSFASLYHHADAALKRG